MKRQHPSVLGTFCATEMWERYGFYAVQTMLTLFMIYNFKWSDTDVYSLVGSFSALTYLSPVIGGFIADKFLGQRVSVLTGALILLVSYIGLAIIHTEKELILALAGIAIGTGLLKPNVTSLVGMQYQTGDSRREHGFVMFYMGITSGIILGTTLPAYLKHLFGWPVIFYSAALGLMLSFVVFMRGIKKHRITDFSVHKAGMINYFPAFVIIVISGLCYRQVMMHPEIADIVFMIIAGSALGYLLITIRSESGKQAQKTMIIAILCLISVVFWSFYFQMFMSIMLFLERAVSPMVFSMAFPPPCYIAVQSIGMILIGFLIKRHDNCSEDDLIRKTTTKFSLSVLLTATAFGIIALIASASHTEILLSPWLMMPVFLILSMAELMLSPVGLSTITLLADQTKVSTMTGVFFVSLGTGSYLAGKFSKMTAINPDMLSSMSVLQLKTHYAIAFGKIAFIAGLMSVLCMMMRYVVNYLLQNDGKSERIILEKARISPVI